MKSLPHHWCVPVFNNIFLLVLSLLVTAHTWAQTEKQDLDWIVATAENGVILNSELELQIADMKSAIADKKLRSMSEEEVHEQALEYLILRQLQLQIGERAGVLISDTQILQTLEKIAASNDTSVEKFQKKLEKEGEDISQYRENLHTQLVIDEVQRGSMRSRIQVSNREVEQFLKSSAGNNIKLGQYNLLHIHLPVDLDTGGTQTESTALTCIDRLRDAIKTDSVEGINHLRNNKKCGARYYDLGWVPFAQTPTLFEEVLPVLDTATLSKPLSTGNGIHLAWLHDRRGGERQIITQHLVSHILIIPSIVRPNESAQRELQEIHQKLLDGGDFAEAALDFSEDPGSKLKGGDLGWVSQGDTDPVFESTVNITPVDGISLPFETQYGWHVLTVLGKRDHNIAPNMIRRQARNILYSRKYNQELDNWLSKIRSESHVQIR